MNCEIIKGSEISDLPREKKSPYLLLYSSVCRDFSATCTSCASLHVNRKGEKLCHIAPGLGNLKTPASVALWHNYN